MVELHDVRGVANSAIAAGTILCCANEASNLLAPTLPVGFGPRLHGFPVGFVVAASGSGLVGAILIRHTRIIMHYRVTSPLFLAT